MIAMMWGYGNGRWDASGMHVGWGAGWVAVVLLAVLVAAVVTVVVVLLLRASGPGPDVRRGTGADEGADARRILEARFARGEIDEEEFRARRDALTSA